MKALVIIANSRDIYAYNILKWMKKSMDVDIDVFEWDNKEDQNMDSTPYCNLIYGCDANHWTSKIKGLRIFLTPIYQHLKLKKFLKGKHYDIIQCHWMIAPLCMTLDLHEFCDKLYVTFWGREYSTIKLFNSKKIMWFYMRKFMNNVDYIISYYAEKSRILGIFPDFKDRYICAELGAGPLENVYNIMATETKDKSKEYYEMPTSKYTIMVGYSGKALHQHIPIIKEFSRCDELKAKLHLLAPMTRGADPGYVKEVEDMLQKSGYSYTVLKDRFLTDDEIARLRNATDITFQLSTTDSFSRTIIECLCAKSIVIYGDWIQYKMHLDNTKLIAYPVSSITDGVNKVKDVLMNIAKYKKDAEQNSIVGKGQYLWSECINDWKEAYINPIEKIKTQNAKH